MIGKAVSIPGVIKGDLSFVDHIFFETVKTVVVIVICSYSP